MEVFYLKSKRSGDIVSRFEKKDNGEFDSCCFEGNCYNYYSWNLDGTPGDDNFFARAYCKWDGCSHWNFNGEDFLEDGIDAYYHICGTGCFLDFIDSMCFIWELARRHFEKVNQNGDDNYVDDERVVKMLKDFNKRYKIVKEIKC